MLRVCLRRSLLPLRGSRATPMALSSQAKPVSSATSGTGCPERAGSFCTRRAHLGMTWGESDISPMTYVSPSVDVTGSVSICDQSSVMANCVLRGSDTSSVIIGPRVHIRDNCVIMSQRTEDGDEESFTRISAEAHIGSGCVLDSCCIGALANIGAGSVISKGCLVGNGAIILENSYLPPDTVVPDDQVWGGSPAQFIRGVSEEEAQAASEHAAMSWNVAQMHKSEVDYYQVGDAYQEKEAVFGNTIGFIPLTSR